MIEWEELTAEVMETFDEAAWEAPNGIPHILFGGKSYTPEVAVHEFVEITLAPYICPSCFERSMTDNCGRKMCLAHELAPYCHSGFTQPIGGDKTFEMLDNADVEFYTADFTGWDANYDFPQVYVKDMEFDFECLPELLSSLSVGILVCKACYSSGLAKSKLVRCFTSKCPIQTISW